AVNDLTPIYISDIFRPFINPQARLLRKSRDFTIPIHYPHKSPIYKMMNLWNDPGSVPLEQKLLPTIASFKRALKLNLFPGVVSTICLKLTRQQELYLNRARVDLILKAQLKP
ncbi:unnamed protein product, partial [Owenia fusiformis]